MTTKRLRLAATTLALLALAIPSSAALAMPAPDGFYENGGPSARWYALFWNGSFVSEVHLKGCGSEIPITQTRQPDGSYRATASGTAKAIPCVVGLGLNMSPAFRSALGTALKAGPTATSFAIVEVDGGKASTEIAASGYISDVTLGTRAGLIEVELVPRSGVLRKRTAAAGRTLGASGIVPVDLAQTALTLDGKDVGTGPIVGPIAFDRQDESITGAASMTVPGGLEPAAPVVSVPAASAVVSALDMWFDDALTGTVASKPLAVTYKSGARSLTIKLDTLPARWDPYPSASGRRLELGASATPTELS